MATQPHCKAALDSPQRNPKLPGAPGCWLHSPNPSLQMLQLPQSVKRDFPPD